jgi:uncharacterized protein
MRFFLLPLLLSFCLTLPLRADEETVQESPLREHYLHESYLKATNFLRLGKLTEAVNLLKNATQKGSIAAMSLLAKLFEEGRGLERSLSKAFDLHKSIIARSSEIKLQESEGLLVASSYVRLGRFYLEGIAENSLPPNAKQAYQLFHYAAVNYSSPEAQFNLGKLLMDGAESVQKDPKQALRWLALAASHSHPGAQALLGIMLYEGKDTNRQPAMGLMYLTLAADGAGKAETWIKERYAVAMANASDDERAAALKLVEKWVSSER